MATRFYLSSTGSAPISVTPDAIWTNTASAVFLPMTRKALGATTTLTDFTVTVPITTVVAYLCAQFVSEPIGATSLAAAPSYNFTWRSFASSASLNLKFAASVRLVSNDGLTVRQLWTQSTNLGSFGTTAVNIASISQGMTQTITAGDRIVVEWGGKPSVAPTVSGSFTTRFGSSGGSDYTTGGGTATDLNPWMDFPTISTGGNLEFASMPGNYQFMKVGNGMSVSEKIR